MDRLDDCSTLPLCPKLLNLQRAKSPRESPPALANTFRNATLSAPETLRTFDLSFVQPGNAANLN